MTQHTRSVDLRIGGMTCASCAARVGKRLNKLDGVDASVNYATELARVTLSDGSVTIEELVTQVETLGYTATPTAASAAAPSAAAPSSVEGAASASDEAAIPDGHEEFASSLRLRLIVSLVLAVPVVAMSMAPVLRFEAWQWVALALTTPVVLWGGLPFHRVTWRNLRHGAASMDTLISLGTLAAFCWSVYALVWGGAGRAGATMPFTFVVDRDAMNAEIYFEVAAAVTVFMLAGRHFEVRAKRRSGAALRALVETGAKDAALLGPDGGERRVAAARLVVGDRFVVRPGEKIATDGVVEEGTSAVDVSLLTGESSPLDVGPGDAVTGATVNVGGRLIVRATRVGEDTALAHIARLVSAAQSGRAPAQRLADRISAVFVPVVLAIAVGTFCVWLAIGSTLAAAFTAGVAVLIVACPCALGLATPTALLVGTGRGAQLGILIKGPQILESTRQVDTIVLDKTGTVTTGVMSLIEVVAADGASDAEALRVAGALEDGSRHPIAQAIVTAARERLGLLPTARSFESLEGLGVRGVVEGRSAIVGRSQLLAGDAMSISAALQTAADAAEARGRTAVFVGWDAAARALLVVSDTVKPTSAQAISRFRQLGLTPILLTGDNARVARAVADEVGVDTVVAEVMPADKARIVGELQASGKVVAMVGDGVNDAAALARADLGIAMGSGADVAVEASDLTLARDDLLGVADAVRLSRRTLATIKANLVWAFGYNVAAIPLAAMGLLNPMIAGAAMALSSVFVVSNSLRLRRFDSAV